MYSYPLIINMKIKHTYFTKFYLIGSILIFPLSSIWPGPSLVLITDALIILVVVDIMLNKRFNRDMKWIITLIVLSLFQMILITIKHNWDILIFLHSRSIFVYSVTTFYFMYTFSNLDSYNLKKMYYFIELIIKFML